MWTLAVVITYWGTLSSEAFTSLDSLFHPVAPEIKIKKNIISKRIMSSTYILSTATPSKFVIYYLFACCIDT